MYSETDVYLVQEGRALYLEYDIFSNLTPFMLMKDAMITVLS
jgi:hypothetical protein